MLQINGSFANDFTDVQGDSGYEDGAVTLNGIPRKSLSWQSRHLNALRADNSHAFNLFPTSPNDLA